MALSTSLAKKKEHGENEVTSPKVNGRGQRSPETACNEGCKEASPTSRAESTQAPSRDRSIKGDPEVSKVNRPVDSEGTVSEAGERNRAGLWIGAEVSVNSGPGTPGSKRGVSHWAVGGHKLVCHSCQSCNYHAERCSACTSYLWRAVLRIWALGWS